MCVWVGMFCSSPNQTKPIRTYIFIHSAWSFVCLRGGAHRLLFGSNTTRADANARELCTSITHWALYYVSVIKPAVTYCTFHGYNAVHASLNTPITARLLSNNEYELLYL